MFVCSTNTIASGSARTWGTLPNLCSHAGLAFGYHMSGQVIFGEPVVAMSWRVGSMRIRRSTTLRSIAA